jgi:hypothetical protein
MTNLPVLATTRTIVQTEARTFAGSWIAKFNAGPNQWSAGSLLSPDASQGFVRDMLRRIACLGDPRMRMQVIASARAGDPDAIEVLRAQLLEYKSQGIGLPTELAAYDMDVTAGNVRPQPGSGPKKKNKLVRNICICMTVAAVTDRFGIDPTGRSPHRKSACEIVGEALADARMSLGRKAVEKIWETYGHAMPTVPGWASAGPS